MAKSASKQTKKFVQSGNLARTIKDRKKKQDVKRKIDNRKALRATAKGGSRTAAANGGGGGDDDDDDDDGNELPLVQHQKSARKGGAGDDEDEDDDEMLDDETLQALLAGSDDDADLGDDGDADDLDEDALEDLEGEEERHRLSLAALKEKDPEFYKYLEENDKALLDFGEDDDDEEEDDDETAEASALLDKKSKKGKEKAKSKVIPVTKDLLKEWQKQMLKQRSLKALRKVLLCFKVASSAGDEDERSAATKKGGKAEQYSIPNAVVFNNVVTVALKYTPLVLNHHVPVKEMANGKFKLPTQSKKYASAQRVIKSYFSSLHALLSTLSSSSSSELTHLTITESSRLIPYLTGNRKASKEYLRVLLEFWASPSASDEIRLSAFLGIRRLALAGDRGLAELVLKGAYLSISQAAKATTVFTLPGLNLMKNSAATLFTASAAGGETQAYQIAFSYIRQLAVTLRNTMKSTSRSAGGSGGGGGAGGAGAGGEKAKGKVQQGKEPYRQVYNWQFCHSLDFWSLVLASACDSTREAEQGKESELRALIYPLVQITLGVIRLVPTSRYYPLRFQLLTSLLRIISRTSTYIPLSPFLLEVLDSSELTKKPKGSSLKPLDFTYYLRAPAAYPKTKVYVDGVIDEVVYLLAEFLASQSTSIAFPELALPIVLSLRKHIKKSRNGKLQAALKELLSRIENNANWIEEKRNKVEFAPSDREQVDTFLLGEEGSPLRTYLKLQRKQRDQKRELLEKSLLEDDDDLPEEAHDAADMEEDQSAHP